MIPRRNFITLLGGAAAAWPVVARGQQGERVRRVGILIDMSERDPEGQLRIAAFRAGLLSLGWLEGRNVQIDARWPGGDAERRRKFAEELVGSKLDVIFAGNTSALVELHRATRDVPIVFVQVDDPVSGGFVASIARPGGNATGFAIFEYGIAAKWVEVLRELSPNLTRIGILYERANAGSSFVSVIQGALPPNMQLVPSQVSSRAEIEETIKKIGSEPNGALIVLGGPLTAMHRDLIAILAVKHHLPTISPYRYFVNAGGLASYGPDTIDQYRVAASYVDRVLKGEKPADLPVQFPTRYKLQMNLKTAKALDLTVPHSLLARTDEVIE